MGKGNGRRVRLRQRRLACENRYFKVFFDDLEGVDGVSVPDYLVVAPKEARKGLITGVGALPVVDGRIALIRVYRHPMGEFAWEVPRGFIDAGEDPSDSACRELEEETGYRCARQDLRFLGFITPEPGIVVARNHLFVAPRCSKIEPFTIREPGHREVRLFTVDDVAGMVKDGSIQDPNTLVAFFRYRELYGSQ